MYQDNKSKSTAVANNSGAMESATISKNEGSSKSQMSRQNIMQRTLLIFAIYCVGIASARAQHQIDEILLPDFESRMTNRGFIKKIVVFDFFSNQAKAAESGVGHKHLYFTGIWVDYQKQIVALRANGSSWNTIEIPFEKIRGAQPKEDGYEITTITPGLFTYRGNTTGYSTGLSVRIITSDANRGSDVYEVKLYDPTFDPGFGLYVTRVNVSDPRYIAMQECADRIIFEINEIMSRQNIDRGTAVQSVPPPQWYSNILFAKKRNVGSISRVSSTATELSKYEVRAMMNNPEALRLYNRSMAFNTTGDICLITGTLTLTIFTFIPLMSQMSKERDGVTITEEDKARTNNLTGAIMATGAAAVITGLILKSSSKSLVKKSVNIHNNGIKNTDIELKVGFIANGVGLTLNF